MVMITSCMHTDKRIYYGKGIHVCMEQTDIHYTDQTAWSPLIYRAYNPAAFCMIGCTADHA